MLLLLRTDCTWSWGDAVFYWKIDVSVSSYRVIGIWSRSELVILFQCYSEKWVAVGVMMMRPLEGGRVASASLVFRGRYESRKDILMIFGRRKDRKRLEEILQESDFTDDKIAFGFRSFPVVFGVTTCTFFLAVVSFRIVDCFSSFDRRFYSWKTHV